MKFSPKWYDNKHVRNILRRANELKAAFDKAVRDGISIGEASGFNDPEGEFYISQYPAIKSRFDRLIASLQQELQLIIGNGINEEWQLSNEKNDALVATVITGTSLPKNIIKRWSNRNLAALAAFKGRKEKGLGLSERVWNLTSQFKSEMELALEIGLGDGLSAAELSRAVRGYLNEPHKLFRRIRDEKGMLRLSKAAAAYHPGQGVYRSSYKNALRLAATEINMAYHSADHERWQQLDFVVGIEVRLSGNHTCLGKDGKPHPFHDICDELAGRYPKDFKFIGWHPNCRCYAVSILKSDKELEADTQRMLDGEPPIPSDESDNAVKEMPQSFNDWVKENQERIAKANERGKLPYFLRDNASKWQKIINSQFLSVKIGNIYMPLTSLLSEASLKETTHGKVWIHLSHGKQEKAENIEIASYFANKYGHRILLLPNPQGVKSPDIFNLSLGTIQEYKVNKTPTTSAVDRSIRDGAKQADEIVLQIKSEISFSELKDALSDRIARTPNVKAVTLIWNNKDVRFDRSQILMPAFKIQPGDFK